MMPFTSSSSKQITVEVSKPWYEHPSILFCLCGTNIYPRHSKDAKVIVTYFECGDPKCGKIVVFKDRITLDSAQSCATIESSGR